MKSRSAWTIIETLVVVSIVAIVLAIAFPLWNAYDARGMQSGVVVDKAYSPPRYGSKSYYPASWRIRVRGLNGNGEMKTKGVEVDETTYHSVENGQEVNLKDL